MHTPTLAHKLRCARALPSAVLKDSGALVTAGSRAVSEYWKPTRVSHASSVSSTASACTGRRSTAQSGSSAASSVTGRRSARSSGSGWWSAPGGGSRTASTVASDGEWDGEGEESAVYDFGRLGMGIEDVARWRGGKGKGKGRVESGSGEGMREGLGLGMGEGDGEGVIYGADEWGSRVGARYV